MDFRRNSHLQQVCGLTGSWLQHAAAPAVASAVFALLLYAVTLGGTYIYDDIPIVRDDPRVHHPQQWVQLWKSGYFSGSLDNLYRPVTSSSYAVEWWLHGDRPWIFHGVNILLHAFTAAAVAEMTRRLLQNGVEAKAQSAAFCAGLLFAVHPVHVEAVANIVGRAELLCTFYILSGLIVFCHRPMTPGRITLLMFIAIAGLLSKEQGILQPLFWLIFALIFWQSISKPAGERFALKLLLLVSSWTWATYLIAREHLLKFEWDRSLIDPIIQPMVASDGIDRVLMPIVLLGRYTALLIWPLHLSIDYSGHAIGSVAHLSDPYLWMGVFTVIVWLVAFVFCALGRNPTRKVILFCLICFAISYGMIGNIITLIGTVFAERLLYLPSAFFLMAISTMLAYLPFKPRVFLLTICLSLASMRTVTAARDWNHPLILFQHDLANEPRSFQLHLLLSQACHEKGDTADANRLLHDLCNLYPDYYRSWMYRAIEDMDDGDLADADTSLKRAIKLKAMPVLIGVADRLSKLHAATQPAAR